MELTESGIFDLHPCLLRFCGPRVGRGSESEYNRRNMFQSIMQYLAELYAEDESVSDICTGIELDNMPIIS